MIDLVWGLNLALAAVVYAAFGSGWGPRRWAIAGMVSLTGLRLSYYLGRRVLSHPEEGRYVALREAWGAHIELKFLGFFLFQAVLVALLSMPYLLASLNADPRFHPLGSLGHGSLRDGLPGRAWPMPS